MSVAMPVPVTMAVAVVIVSMTVDVLELHQLHRQPVTVALDPEDPVNQRFDDVDDEEAGAEGELGERVGQEVRVLVKHLRERLHQTRADFRQHVDEDGGEKDAAADAHEAGHQVLDELLSGPLAEEERQQAADQLDEAQADEDDDFDSHNVHLRLPGVAPIPGN